MGKFSRYSLIYTNYRKRYRKYKDYATGSTGYVALVGPTRELRKLHRSARNAVNYLNEVEERLARGREYEREQDTCDDCGNVCSDGCGVVPDGTTETPPSVG